MYLHSNLLLNTIPLGGCIILCSHCQIRTLGQQVTMTMVDLIMVLPMKAHFRERFVSVEKSGNVQVGLLQIMLL